MCFLIKTLLFVCHDKNNIVYFIVHNSKCCLLWCFLGQGTVGRPLGLGDTNPTLVSLTRFLQAGILCLGLIIICSSLCTTHTVVVFSWSGNSTLLLVDRLACGDTNPTLVSLARFLQAGILCLGLDWRLPSPYLERHQVQLREKQRVRSVQTIVRRFIKYSTTWV